MPSILVVDDDKDICLVLSKFFGFLELGLLGFGADRGTSHECRRNRGGDFEELSAAEWSSHGEFLRGEVTGNCVDDRANADGSQLL